MNEYIEALEHGTIDEINQHRERLFNDPKVSTSDQTIMVELYQTLKDPTLYELNYFVQLINFTMVERYHLIYDPMLGELTNPRTNKTMTLTPSEALLEIIYTLNH